MSRKAIPQDINVPGIIAKINEYLITQNISANKLAELARVDQGGLYRFMKGGRKTVTDIARTVNQYIDRENNRHNRHNIVGKREANMSHENGYLLIENAIRSIWDGKQQTARILAPLILALKPALDLVSSTNESGLKEDRV